MAGNVDHVIDAAENAVIAIRRKHGAVRGVIWPIAPIFALRIFVVLFVVLVDEALRAAPNGLHNPGPRIADANISGSARSSSYLFSFFIPNDRINAKRRRSRAARLHGIERRFSGAEKTSGFRLPPRVDNRSLLLADDVVIPAPDFRLDGLADRGHVLEMVVVLLGLVGACFTQHANRGGRGVEDIYIETFRDSPWAAGVRKLRYTLIEDARCCQGERAVDNIRMPGDPADVGHTPIDIGRMNVLVVLGSAGDIR